MFKGHPRDRVVHHVPVALLAGHALLVRATKRYISSMLMMAVHALLARLLLLLPLLLMIIIMIMIIIYVQLYIYIYIYTHMYYS